MIWGGMSVNGTAGLFFLAVGTTVNAQRYTDLMKNKLELHMTVHNCSFHARRCPMSPSQNCHSFFKDKSLTGLETVRI